MSSALAAHREADIQLGLSEKALVGGEVAFGIGIGRGHAHP
jgi:hypothetical protein